jgi:hypothetical protein
LGSKQKEWCERFRDKPKLGENMLKEMKRWFRKLRKNIPQPYISSWNNDVVAVNIPTDNSTIISNTDWITTPNSNTPGQFDIKPNVDTRIEKKPVEIFNEIVSEKPIMNLTNLDKQIRLVKNRKRVLEEHIGESDSRHEDEALSYLRARKKFIKCSGLFKWPTTNQEKVNDLCKKYKVMSVAIGGYYRNLPMEAIDEMEKYTKAHYKITRNKPVFTLIVDQGGKEQKKDPILLVCSPFGRWYYILGAWDKEVEIVDDLIYKGK